MAGDTVEFGVGEDKPSGVFDVPQKAKAPPVVLEPELEALQNDIVETVQQQYDVDSPGLSDEEKLEKAIKVADELRFVKGLPIGTDPTDARSFPNNPFARQTIPIRGAPAGGGDPGALSREAADHYQTLMERLETGELIETAWGALVHAWNKGGMPDMTMEDAIKQGEFFTMSGEEKALDISTPVMVGALAGGGLFGAIGARAGAKGALVGGAGGAMLGGAFGAMAMLWMGPNAEWADLVVRTSANLEGTRTRNWLTEMGVEGASAFLDVVAATAEHFGVEGAVEGLQREREEWTKSVLASEYDLTPDQDVVAGIREHDPYDRPAPEYTTDYLGFAATYAARTAALVLATPEAQQAAFLNRDQAYRRTQIATLWWGVVEAVRVAKEEPERAEESMRTIAESLEGLTYAALPEHVQKAEPSLVLFKEFMSEIPEETWLGPELSEFVEAYPGTKRLGDAYYGGKSDDDLQGLLNGTPFGQLGRLSATLLRGVMPSTDEVWRGGQKSLLAVEGTGGISTKLLERSFGRMMFDKVTIPATASAVDGSWYTTESTPGKVMRMAFAAPTLLTEFDAKVSIPMGMVDGEIVYRPLVLTPAAFDRIHGLGIRNPDNSYMANVMGRIHSGEIGLYMTNTEIMRSMGMKPGEGWWDPISTVSVLLDFLVPWERPAFKAAGFASRTTGGVLSGAKAAKVAPANKLGVFAAHANPFADPLETIGNALLAGNRKARAKGGSPLEHMTVAEIENLKEALRTLGVENYEELIAAELKSGKKNKKLHAAIMQRYLENGTPEQVAMRGSVGWRRVWQQLYTLARAGEGTMDEALANISALEVIATRVAADPKHPKYKTPMQFFDDYAITRGGRVGPNARFKWSDDWTFHRPEVNQALGDYVGDLSQYQRVLAMADHEWSPRHMQVSITDSEGILRGGLWYGRSGEAPGTRHGKISVVLDKDLPGYDYALRHLMELAAGLADEEGLDALSVTNRSVAEGVADSTILKNLTETPDGFLLERKYARELRQADQPEGPQGVGPIGLYGPVRGVPPKSIRGGAESAPVGAYTKVPEKDKVATARLGKTTYKPANGKVYGLADLQRGAGEVGKRPTVEAAQSIYLALGAEVKYAEKPTGTLVAKDGSTFDLAWESFDWSDSAEPLLRLMDGDNQVGHLRVKPDFDMKKLIPESKHPDELQALHSIFGDAPVVRAWTVEVDYALRGKGIATSMYEAAIARTLEEHPGGFYFISSAYGRKGEGTTKPGASAVWAKLGKERPSRGEAIYVSPYAQSVASFGDEAHTTAWRATDEIAHGIVNERMTKMYGEQGARDGALGVQAVNARGVLQDPLALQDALRAVDWEHEIFMVRRRVLEEDFGIKITDDQFAQEYMVNMGDTVHRVLSGKSSDPLEIGINPVSISPDVVLAKAKVVIRQAAEEMNIGMEPDFYAARGEQAPFARTATLEAPLAEPPDIATLKLGITGYRMEFPDLEGLRSRYEEVMESYLRSEPGDPESASLLRNASLILDEFYLRWEGHLRNQFDAEGLIHVVDIERGFGGFAADPIEPNMVVKLRGDRDVINGRIAQFSRWSGQPGRRELLTKEFVSGEQFFDERPLRLAKRGLEEGSKSRELLVYMTPDEFLTLAEALPEDAVSVKSTLERINDALDGDKKLDDIPFLQMADGKIVGHEGRHRAMALRERGQERFPVRLWDRKIRWGQQRSPESGMDYVKELPTHLISEDGLTRIEAPYHVDGPDRGAPRGRYAESTIEADVVERVPQWAALVREVQDVVVDAPDVLLPLKDSDVARLVFEDNHGVQRAATAEISLPMEWFEPRMWHQISKVLEDYHVGWTLDRSNNSLVFAHVPEFLGTDATAPYASPATHIENVREVAIALSDLFDGRGVESMDIKWVREYIYTTMEKSSVVETTTGKINVESYESAIRRGLRREVEVAKARFEEGDGLGPRRGAERPEGVPEGVEGASGEGGDKGVGKAGTRGRYGIAKKFGIPNLLTKSVTRKPKGKSLTKDIKEKGGRRTLDDLDARLENIDPEKFFTDERVWNKFWVEASGEQRIPIRPLQLVEYAKNPDLMASHLSQATPEQVLSRRLGFSNAKMALDAYHSGLVAPEGTAQYFLWSILSRRLATFPQEAKFLDAVMDGVDYHIKSALDHEWTQVDLDKYEAWAAHVSSRDSAGGPATGNLNSYGRTFLMKLSKHLPEDHPYMAKIMEGLPDGTPIPKISKLDALHRMFSDPAMSGKKLRREFSVMVDDPGMALKVFSFMLLVTGRTDVMVLDRVQFRHLWGARTMPEIFNFIENIYEGIPVVGGKKGGLAAIGEGSYGLALYEMMEAYLSGVIEKAYADAGRPQDASLGGYHWDTWVIESAQEVAHGTTELPLLRALSMEDLAIGTASFQGKFQTVQYGTKYATLGKNHFGWVIRDSENVPYVLDYGARKRFKKEIDGHGDRKGTSKNLVERIVPHGFKITDERYRGVPWTSRPEVNRTNLDALIHKLGRKTTPSETRYLHHSEGYGLANAELDGIRRPRPLTPAKLKYKLDDEGAPLGAYEYDTRTGKSLIHLFQGGDLNVLFHENGHMLMQFFGDDWRNTMVRHFDSKRGPDGIERLTPLGEEQAADAFMHYMQTKHAHNSGLRRQFGQLFLWLRDFWARIWGKQEFLPPEIAQMWDAWLRPDRMVEPAVISSAERVQARLKRFPEVKIIDAEVEIYPNPGDDVGVLRQARVEKAGKAREFHRVDLNRANLRKAVGLPSERYLQEHGPIQMDGGELIDRLVSVMAVEQARKATSVDRLTKLTTRTIVPASRAKAVQTRANDRWLSTVGVHAEEIAPTVVEHNVQGTGVKMDVMRLDPLQAAGFKRLVYELAADPLGNIIPDRLLHPDADLRVVSVEDYNFVREVLVDAEAGPGARNTAYSEKISPTLGNAIWDGIWSTVGSFTPIGRRWKQAFQMPKFGKDHFSPVVRDLIENRMRELTDVHPWINRIIREAKRGDKSRALGMVYKDLIGKLTPIVDVHDLGTLDRVLNALNGLSEEGLKGPEPRAVPGAAVRGAKAGAVTSPDLHYFFSMIDQIQGLLHKGRGLSAEEGKAIDLVRMYKTHGVSTLGDADRLALGDAINTLHMSLENTKQAISASAREIATSAAGAHSDAFAAQLVWPELKRVYRDFYSGNLTKLFVFVAEKGRETGLRPDTVPKFDLSTSILEMIARMRANEVISGLSRDLATYGITSDVLKVANAHKIGTLVDRSHFVDRVTFYINQALYFEDIIRVEKLGMGDTPRDRTSRRIQPKAPGKETPLHDLRSEGRKGQLGTGPHDMLAYTTAHDLLNEWGFKIGLGSWERKVLPDGTEALLPHMVINEIEAAVDRVSQVGFAWTGKKGGTFWEGGLTRKVFGQDRVHVPLEGVEVPYTPKVQRMMALNEAITKIIDLNPLTLARMRMGVTTGLGMVHPAYFVAVFLGNPFQIWQAKGLGYAAKYTAKTPVTAARGAVGLLTGRADMVGAVMTRLWRHGDWSSTAKAIVSKDGRVYTANSIELLARREGLKSSFIRAETTQSLAKDVRDHFPEHSGKLMKHGRWFQSTLMEVATSIDSYFRLSVFVDGLEAGHSPSKAASVARKAVLDYGALTDFEKKWCRTFFFFYSFSRKNMDLFWDSVLTAPERTIAQMRMTRGLQQLWLDTEDEEGNYVRARPEFILRDYMKGRFLAYARDASANTYMYDKVGWIIPPTPFYDAMMLPLAVYDAFAFSGEERGQAGARHLLSQLTPFVQAPFVYAFEKEVYSGRDIRFRTQIPGWLVEMDVNLGGPLMDLFDARAVPARNPMYADLPGGHYVWEAKNEFAWWLWSGMLQTPISGRALQTVSTLDKANTGAVELLVEATGILREKAVEMGWADAPIRSKPILPGFPKDTMVPREEFRSPYGAEKFSPVELLALFGVKPVWIEHSYIVQDRLRGEAKRKQEAELRELKKAQP